MADIQIIDSLGTTFPDTIQRIEKGGSRMKEPARKLLVYEILSELNERFEQALLDIEGVRELGILRREFPREIGVIFEETRAWTNFEMLEAMQEREQAIGRDSEDFAASSKSDTRTRTIF